MEGTKFKSIALSFILAIALLIIGGLLNNYFFKDKPALTYQTYEADPIETESGVYYSTSIIITNSGNTPLSAVAVFLKFNGKVIKVSSDFIYGVKNEDDSLNVKREFRMPINTFVELRVTSRGKLAATSISSAEVYAVRKEETADDKKTISNLSSLLAITVIFWLFTFLAIYFQHQEIKRLKAVIDKMLEERKKITT